MMTRPVGHPAAIQSDRRPVGKDLGLSLAHPVRFFRRYISQPDVVGAVAPSSKALARCICEPLQHRNGPVTVLEIGAGTGPFTRYLGSILDEDDGLDIYEIHADFARILERDVLSNDSFAPRVARGRVRLFKAPIQELSAERHYDFVICGLPLNSFELSTVQEVVSVIRRALKPGGVFSYFEYIGLRTVLRTCSYGETRERVHAVSAFLTDMIGSHQFARRTVVRNFPPAHARHLRFDAEAPTSRGS